MWHTTYLLVPFATSVTHVQSRHVHSVTCECFELLVARRRGADRADELGAPGGPEPILLELLLERLVDIHRGIGRGHVNSQVAPLPLAPAAPVQLGRSQPALGQVGVDESSSSCFSRGWPSTGNAAFRFAPPHNTCHGGCPQHLLVLCRFKTKPNQKEKHRGRSRNTQEGEETRSTRKRKDCVCSSSRSTGVALALRLRKAVPA